ncbi:MAG: bacillithiol biosynthesis BshC [Candidatus Eisenbacteria bacterium]
MKAGTLAVRTRVTGRAESPFDRLHDPITRDLLDGGPIACERFARLWTSDAQVAELTALKRRPLDPALARAMAEQHARLGASPASLANLERLAKGEAVAAVAGQQPAPLGGPLYSLHKIASSAGIARTVQARTGTPCVPLFWMHGEDSDFAEIRHASVLDANLELHDFVLPDDAHATGGLVGGVPVAPLAALHAEALAKWAGLPGHADAAALLARAQAAGRDLGEVTIALLLGLFADAGLVVVDPRLGEFRAAARPFVERYLANAEVLQAAAVAAGARLQALAGRTPLSEASLESFVFEIAGGARHKLSAADARARGAAVTLSPSVALRPAVQDGVFPTVAMAVGPGEIAYLAQLREVFAGVGVEPAVLVPRFGATWLPAAAVEFLEASQAAGEDAWHVVAETDAALAAFAASRVPADVEGELLAAKQAALDGLTRFADRAKALDGSFPQMVESARGKVDYQFARLHEGLVSKVRARFDKEHPVWRRLRYALAPGGKLQERRIASLEPVARQGVGVVAMLCDAAAEHAAGAARGVHEHWLLEA